MNRHFSFVEEIIVILDSLIESLPVLYIILS